MKFVFMKVLILIPILCFGQDFDNKSQNNISGDFDSSQIEQYIKSFDFGRQAHKEWISQKQIAAWGAFVLFLTFMFVLSKKFNFLVKIKKSSIFIILFISFLFSLFIHQQYGSMVYSIARNSVVSKTILSTIINKNLPEYVDTSNEKLLAESLDSLTNLEVKKIRKFPFYIKPFVPLFKLGSIFSDCKISTIEVEEGILYDIIFVVTFFLIILLLKNKFINDFQK